MATLVLATTSEELDQWILSTFPEFHCVGKARSWQELARLLQANRPDLAVIAGAALICEGPAQNLLVAFRENVARHFDGPVLLLLPDSASGIVPSLTAYNVLVHQGDRIYHRRLANELESVLKAIENAPFEDTEAEASPAQQTPPKPRKALVQVRKERQQ